jgi:hypothetical protein
LLGPLDAPDSLLKSLTVDNRYSSNHRATAGSSFRSRTLGLLLLGASLRDEITVAFRYRT